MMGFFFLSSHKKQNQTASLSPAEEALGSWPFPESSAVSFHSGGAGGVGVAGAAGQLSFCCWEGHFVWPELRGGSVADGAAHLSHSLAVSWHADQAGEDCDFRAWAQGSRLGLIVPVPGSFRATALPLPQPWHALLLSQPRWI